MVEQILSWASFKQARSSRSRTAPRRRGSPAFPSWTTPTTPARLNPALHLILTEGDPPAAVPASGGRRDRYGVFPLAASPKARRVARPDHEQRRDFVHQADPGLRHDGDDSVKSLHGHIMIMTDQDHDGSHIKGL